MTESLPENTLTAEAETADDGLRSSVVREDRRVDPMEMQVSEGRPEQGMRGLGNEPLSPRGIAQPIGDFATPPNAIQVLEGDSAQDLPCRPLLDRKLDEGP